MLTIRNLMRDLSLPEGHETIPIWNDNRGCVDWTKGVYVSKKLRHINMRELSVRLYQKLGYVNVQHMEGRKNIADIFTKEIKDAKHFRSMAFTITPPRLLANWDLTTGINLVKKWVSGVRGVLSTNPRTTVNHECAS
jgi:hypothetical protein